MDQKTVSPKFFCLTLYSFHLFFFIVKCCKNLYVMLFGNAKKIHGEIADGTYTMSSTVKENGRNHWKRKDDLMALWFDSKKDRWTLSSSYGVDGSIVAPSMHMCPSRSGNSWKYYDKDSNSLNDGQHEIKVLCLGLLIV